MASPENIKEDIRSRVLVLVEQSDAPNYQEFLCPDCDMPVAQLHNCQILGISDVIDFDTRSQPLIGVPHKGRLAWDGIGERPGYCRTRFYYTLGEVKA